jgi:hypothetical protein
MKNYIYILHIIIAILFFASCEDDGAIMLNDNEPCYTIFVSAPNVSGTRATYDDRNSEIAVKWEKGDVIVLSAGGENYSFLYRESAGDVGEFFHYGKISASSDGSLPEGSMLTFGNVQDGNNTKDQVQKKNKICREYLTANMAGKKLSDITSTKPVNLLPADNMSLLHVHVKSPGMFLEGSLLKIKGLDQSEYYNITLGEDPSLVFADAGEDLDIYVVVPAGETIKSGTTLKFYFYAYDEFAPKNKDKKTNGDEYHYYMKCNGTIETKNNEVVKMQLPNKPTHTAIQLGLSVKWATMNIGATSDQPGEASFGKYLPWGMTEEHYEYAWEDPNLSMLYRKTDEELKAVFGDEFSGSIQGITPREYMGDTYGDPATCLWGDDWVIPTKDQINELMNQMKNTKVQGAKFTDWVEWADKNVVVPHVKTNGCYVYGKNAYSNKKVWFPAAGGVHSEKRGTPESPASNDGCNGVYMTATTVLTNPGGRPGCYVFMFNGYVKNGSVGDFSLGCSDKIVYNFDTRIHGCSVRPIRKP